MIIPKKPYLPPHPIQHFIKFLSSDATDDDTMPLSLALVVMLCCFVDAVYTIYL